MMTANTSSTDQLEPAVQRSPFRLEYAFIHQLSEQEYIDLYHIVSDPNTMQWIGDSQPWSPQRLLERRNYSAKDFTLPWTKRTYFYWAILRRADKDGVTSKKVIGMFGLHPVVYPLPSNALQVMYIIAPAERGHGYAAHAIHDMMTRPEFTSETRAIYATIHEKNVPSVKTILNSGLFERDHKIPSIKIRQRSNLVFRYKPT